MKIGVAVTLWGLPFLFYGLFSPDFSFWAGVSNFFTKAAFVTFGGAYAVLPYVAQISVEKFHWLSELQMIDGMALGETTPGPLILVLVFVGFMAGYHHHGNSILAGTAGLFVTSYYTFLPSFLFILIGGATGGEDKGQRTIEAGAVYRYGSSGWRNPQPYPLLRQISIACKWRVTMVPHRLDVSFFCGSL